MDKKYLLLIIYVLTSSLVGVVATYVYLNFEFNKRLQKENEKSDSLVHEIWSQEILLAYYERLFFKKRTEDSIRIAGKYFTPSSLEKEAITRAKNYSELIAFIATLSLENVHLKHIPSILPVKEGSYKNFSSQFRIRNHPIHKEKELHNGLDISAIYGTPVYATGDGVVIHTVKSNSGYGNMIELEHNFGFRTLYGHLSNLVVEKGMKVKQRDVIGFIGSTGLSIGPHLHYEVKKNGKNLDPYHFCFIENELRKDSFGD